MIKKLIFRMNKFIPTIINLALLFFVILVASNGIFDTDIWLHLKTGQLIVKDLNIPTADPYSFTIGGKQWINHEWLFQVIVHLAFSLFSIKGLVFLQTLFIVLAFSVLFLIGFKNERFLLTVFLVSILTVFASRTRFNLRPDVLSLIFLSIFLYQLKFSKNNKIIYLLIFWQLLWVNCHGYFFLGPLLVLIFIIAELIKRHVKNLPAGWLEVERIADEDFKRLLRVFLLLVLVSLVNPQFLKGAMYPFYILSDLISGKANFALKHVEELARAFSIKGNAFVGNTQFKILALLAAGSLIFTWRKLDIACLLLFLFFAPFGFIALRNVAFLSFVAYVIIISSLESIEDMVKARVNIDAANSILSKFVKFSLIILLAIYLGKEGYKNIFRTYYNFDTHEIKSGVSEMLDYRYPKKCVDFLIKHNLARNIYNDFNSGAYLIFHAWPKYKVFVDGRTELYPDNFLESYFKIMRGDRKLFDTQVGKFNINTVILNNATANIPKDIFKMLYEHPMWQIVFFDDDGAVFLKKTPENNSLIMALGINLKQWRAPEVDFRRLTLARVAPDPYTSRARLLDILGLDEAVISEINMALKISPNSGLAHFYLGKIFLKHNRLISALEHLRLAYGYGYRNIEARLLLARALARAGDKERAQVLYRGILKDNPKEKEAREFLANISKKANLIKN